jgi:dTDP-4-dehydrorhamnose reductase
VKLLVTGASGLLGSKLCELAIHQGINVHSAYNRHRPSKGIPVEFDLSEKTKVEKIFKRIKPEAVVHAAALTNVDKCEVEKDLSWKINVEGTEAIAKACTKNQAFLLYVSTDYVFDGEKGMYTEKDVTNPINYYGYTKLKGEEAVANSVDEACIARTSVIYGTAPATGKTNFALWLLDKLGKKETMRIANDQFNSPTLNINLASMILEILGSRLTGTFHLAGATRLTRFQYATALAKEFNMDTSLIEPVSSDEIPWTAKRPKDSSLNVGKAMRTLDKKPMEIQAALRKMKRSWGIQSN